MSKEDLIQEARVIRYEKDPGDNTAERVGKMFMDIIDSLGDNGGGSGGGGGGSSYVFKLSDWTTALLAQATGTYNGSALSYNGTNWTWLPISGSGGNVSEDYIKGVLWSALSNNDDNKISLSHLDLSGYLLKSTTFWGASVGSDWKVKGDMINVGSITMENDQQTFKIELDDNGNLKFNGSIYATGGFSALGQSSGGSGGGNANLNALLNNLNTDTNIGNKTPREASSTMNDVALMWGDEGNTHVQHWYWGSPAVLHQPLLSINSSSAVGSLPEGSDPKVLVYTADSGWSYEDYSLINGITPGTWAAFFNGEDMPNAAADPGYLYYNPSNSSFSLGDPTGSLPSYTEDDKDKFLKVNDSGTGTEWVSGTGGVAKVLYKQGNNSSVEVAGSGDELTLVAGDNISFESAPPNGIKIKSSGGIKEINVSNNYVIQDSGSTSSNGVVTLKITLAPNFAEKGIPAYNKKDEHHVLVGAGTGDNNAYPFFRALTADDIPSGISGVKITGVVESANFANRADNADTATKLAASVGLWGQTFDGTNSIGYDNTHRANLEYVANIYSQGDVYFNDLEYGIFIERVFNEARTAVIGNAITWHKPDPEPPATPSQNAGTYKLLTFIAEDRVWVEQNLFFRNVSEGVTQDEGVYINGTTINWYKNDSYSSNVVQFYKDRVELKGYTDTSVTPNVEKYVDLKIGDCVLSWNANTNSLKVQKSDGTAANFYATGDVGALGIPNSSGGSVESATINNLTSTNITSTDISTDSIITGAAGCDNDALKIRTVSGNASNPTPGDETVLECTKTTYEVQEGGATVQKVSSSVNVHADRFYLADGVYLHWDSGNSKLKLFDGTNDREVSLV